MSFPPRLECDKQYDLTKFACTFGRFLRLLMGPLCGVDSMGYWLDSHTTQLQSSWTSRLNLLSWQVPAHALTKLSHAHACRAQMVG